MKPVVVVGGGIFGITVASVLQEAGHRVVIYDKGEPMAGSKPSGGLMKPSWLSILNKGQIDASFALLDHHFGVSELDFTVLPTSKTLKLYRIDMNKVFTKMPIHYGVVTRVEPGRVWLAAKEDEPESRWSEMDNCIVVVAAGYWSKKLLDLPDMKGKTGVSFRVDRRLEPTHQFKVWAPYKQAMAAYNGDGTTWMGDGTAILSKNWKPERVEQSRLRLHSTFDLGFAYFSAAHVGIRPILSNGYRQLAPDLFLCTGAGKNGSAMAGVYAQKVLEAIS